MVVNVCLLNVIFYQYPICCWFCVRLRVRDRIRVCWLNCISGSFRCLGRGGWDLMYTWFKEAKDEDNTPFLAEILQVYQNIPVTLALLKQNSTAKSIKSLMKSSDNEGKFDCIGILFIGIDEQSCWWLNRFLYHIFHLGHPCRSETSNLLSKIKHQYLCWCCNYSKVKEVWNSVEIFASWCVEGCFFQFSFQGLLEAFHM